MVRIPDEFEMRARDVLKGEDSQMLTKLLALRTETQRLAEKQWQGSRAPNAAALNARNQKMFDRAAELIGAKNFERIFGFPPTQKINLVDPEILEAEIKKGQKSSQQTRSPVHTASPAPTTVTLKQLAADIADERDMSKKQAEEILSDLVSMMVKHLKKGERIRIGGFGILQVRKRAARMGRNPATGEMVKIKPRKNVTYRASKELKNVL